MENPILSVNENIPALNGLILSGGKSSRMGREKRLLEYHGKTQEQYLFDLLKPFCAEVFVSVNSTQQTDLKAIVDAFEVDGPMAGILSAFSKNAETAWLIVACDMPFVDKQTINYLVQHRNPQKMATVFRNPVENFPEPLLAIYEPSILPLLKEAMANSEKSPRKVIQKTETELLEIPDVKALENANEPKDFIKAKLDLGDKQP
ncbi:molybdopterin-guanine dinucleotide biosynthesis protein A [Pseudarcicella hirudinis]|uniref:Probable molybdenum cofactor guanylyltransferase n=1 Tax=Pseudarcicella hirudinis TaxID=1079859 RepID=A0A1I5NZ73_9BACT|nr:molybdopterin-guanine dinucleotide biosynthesis protein A [Pseudarcicella hirudinis]